MMDRVKLGDRRAFETIYRHSAQQLYSVARSMLGSPTDAEDCVAEVYMAAWKNAPSYESARGSVLAWLLNMCRSRAIDRLRRTQTQRQNADKLSIGEQLATPDRDPAQRFGGFLAFGKLQRALSMLSPAQRQALELAYWGGYTHSEIAAHTGWPAGTAKSHVRRAVEILRKECGDHE